MIETIWATNKLDFFIFGLQNWTVNIFCVWDGPLVNFLEIQPYSWKWTNSSTEKGSFVKGKASLPTMFQPWLFRGYVSFRGSIKSLSLYNQSSVENHCPFKGISSSRHPVFRWTMIADKRIVIRNSNNSNINLMWGSQNWLVVSTHLKNISQNGNLPQLGVKIKHIWNHHLEKVQLCASDQQSFNRFKKPNGKSPQRPSSESIDFVAKDLSTLDSSHVVIVHRTHLPAVCNEEAGWQEGTAKCLKAEPGGSLLVIYIYI